MHITFKLHMFLSLVLDGTHSSTRWATRRRPSSRRASIGALARRYGQAGSKCDWRTRKTRWVALALKMRVLAGSCWGTCFCGFKKYMLCKSFSVADRHLCILWAFLRSSFSGRRMCLKRSLKNKSNLSLSMASSTLVHCRDSSLPRSFFIRLHLWVYTMIID